MELAELLSVKERARINCRSYCLRENSLKNNPFSTGNVVTITVEKSVQDCFNACMFDEGNSLASFFLVQNSFYTSRIHWVRSHRSTPRILSLVRRKDYIESFGPSSRVSDFSPFVEVMI